MTVIRSRISLTDYQTLRQNGDTGDQELLALIIALRECIVYLRGRKFLFRTDHEPIRYLQTKTTLAGRQYRWLDILQEIVYDHEHISGNKHVAPDALSRIPDHIPPQRPRLQRLTIIGPSLPERIVKAYVNDTWA